MTNNVIRDYLKNHNDKMDKLLVYAILNLSTELNSIKKEMVEMRKVVARQQ